jgi:hypothetical protein
MLNDDLKKSNLNKEEPQINRGFELMLRQNSRREVLKSKTFDFRFEKTLSLLNREIQINFDFGLDIKKITL